MILIIENKSLACCLGDNVLSNPQHIVQSSNFKSLNLYVLILLVACAMLLYGHIVGAQQTDTSSESELPSWQILEHTVLYGPAGSSVPDQAGDINFEDGHPSIDPSESDESIISEVSTVSTQAGDTDSESNPLDGLPTTSEEQTTQEIPETGRDLRKLTGTAENWVNIIQIALQEQWQKLLDRDCNKNCVNRLSLTLTIGEDRCHEKARTGSLRT